MGKFGTAIKLMVNGAMGSRVEIMNQESNNRILKVEEVGDFWRKNTKPRIRLKGKWMIKAGILPNNYVQVSNPQPGVLILQMVEEEVKLNGEA